MDTVSLVDGRIDDGLLLVGQLVRDGFDVTAAFWLKGHDEDRWHLYIASKVVRESGPGRAYRVFQETLQRLPGLSVSLEEIKAVSPSDPTAKAILRAWKRHPAPSPGARLEELPVGEAYIYPPMKSGTPAAKTLVARKVKLKTDVGREPGLQERAARLTPEEVRMAERLIENGLDRQRAEYWVRQRRANAIRGLPTIPAGTVVKARVAAWVGDEPADDPDPLLEVETDDGAQGLTFKSNTEPA